MGVLSDRNRCKLDPVDIEFRGGMGGWISVKGRAHVRRICSIVKGVSVATAIIIIFDIKYDMVTFIAHIYDEHYP